MTEDYEIYCNSESFRVCSFQNSFLINTIKTLYCQLFVPQISVATSFLLKNHTYFASNFCLENCFQVFRLKNVKTCNLLIHLKVINSLSKAAKTRFLKTISFYFWIYYLYMLLLLFTDWLLGWSLLCLSLPIASLIWAGHVLPCSTQMMLHHYAYVSDVTFVNNVAMSPHPSATKCQNVNLLHVFQQTLPACNRFLLTH